MGLGQPNQEAELPPQGRPSKWWGREEVSGQCCRGSGAVGEATGRIGGLRRQEARLFCRSEQEELVGLVVLTETALQRAWAESAGSRWSGPAVGEGRTGAESWQGSGGGSWVQVAAGVA